MASVHLFLKMHRKNILLAAERCSSFHR